MAWHWKHVQQRLKCTGWLPEHRMTNLSIGMVIGNVTSLLNHQERIGKGTGKFQRKAIIVLHFKSLVGRKSQAVLTICIYWSDDEGGTVT